MQAIARKPSPFLLLLLILGAWLRVYGLSTHSLWFDETFSQRVVSLFDPISLFQNGVAGDVHPPLYFALLWLWVQFVGDSVVALRMLSVLIALLALTACYHLARLLFNRRAATLALILAAFAPYQVYYAQETRQYALSFMALAWAGVGLAALWRGKHYGGLLYAISALVSLYTHYICGLTLAVLHLWLLGYAPMRAKWRQWLSADALIALLYLPQVFTFLSQTSAVFSGFWIRPPSVLAPVFSVSYLIFAVVLPVSLIPLGVVAVWLLLAVNVLDMRRVKQAQVRAAWLFCLLAVFGTLIAALIVSIRAPIYSERSFGMIAPFMVVALAGAVAYAPRRSPARLLYGALILICLGGLIAHYTPPDLLRPPFRQIAADLRALPEPERVPILYLHDGAYLPMTYYAPELMANSRLVFTEARSWLYPRTWELLGIKRYSRAEIAAWLGDYQGTLRVVYYGGTLPEEEATLRALLARCPVQRELDYPPFVILYEVQCDVRSDG
ncbi:MAG: hypothetical protein CUN49_09805 [Candidatus Thermofonsia Clade 1 bacterium]|uniref:Glycosyltransferase RgtA/B/C/D-like domain-containing protein n=1 Tax=Candidatus Thermofonsia Clade 1 bacterium TaxID=2364210 RepID=A0A2M8PDG6_9CHLR|nr:MAG: hypothetical protein CUN49_09805 [Candidatus Thermofonsia Clade 1 bacterium]